MGRTARPAVVEPGTTIVDALVQHRPLLVNAAATITGCRSRAEDVVQDVYLKVSELDPNEPIRQPMAYLFRMVRNLAIDHYRRQSFESRHYVDEEAGAEVPSPYPTPEASVIQRDTAWESIPRACARPLAE